MMKKSFKILLVLAALLWVVTAARAQEWTRFRGPNGSGVCEGPDIPAAWTEMDYNWRVKLPGAGHSQPVIWGERIFLTSGAHRGARRLVLCLKEADGGIAWQREYAMGEHKKHDFNSYASSTPAVDGERIYISFAEPEKLALKALGHQGEEKWSRDLGPFHSQHGSGSSPVLFEDKVILAGDQDADSFLIALDRATGAIRWKTERRSKITAYGTPCLFVAPGAPAELIVSSQAHGLSSLDPSTGSLNWEAPLFDMRTVSSPVLAGSLVLATCGSGGGGNYLVAVRGGGKGDVSASHLAYKLTRAIPYVPTPLIKGDRLFLWSDKGVVSCLKAASGETVWQNRIGGNYFGSPVCIGDRLYGVSVDGEVVVVAAADDFKVLGRTHLGEGSHSTPAVAGGRLYLRTHTQLFSIGGKKNGKDMP